MVNANDGRSLLPLRIFPFLEFLLIITLWDRVNHIVSPVLKRHFPGVITNLLNYLIPQYPRYFPEQNRSLKFEFDEWFGVFLLIFIQYHQPVILHG
jgi:hypothetical protein